MKKIKIIFTVLFLATVVINTVNHSNNEAENKETITIPFFNGEYIEVPSEIDTYATLQPSYTETLIDLGFEKNIVTIDKNSTYLNVYNNVGVFDTEKIDVNHEILVENKPEVILVDALTYEKFTTAEVAEIEQKGSIFVVLPIPRDVEGVKSELEFLVNLTNARYGEDILEDFDLKYDQIKNWNSLVEESPKVFLQTSQVGKMTTSGEGTLIDEMITLAGAENAFKDRSGVIYTNYEQIAEQNPDYYFSVTNGDRLQKSQILNQSLLQNTLAIRNGDVYVFTEIQMFNPNYRCLDAIITMGCILHKDIYQ